MSRRAKISRRRSHALAPVFAVGPVLPQKDVLVFFTRGYVVRIELEANVRLPLSRLAAVQIIFDVDVKLGGYLCFRFAARYLLSLVCVAF